jgi:hypothetical protein
MSKKKCAKEDAEAVKGSKVARTEGRGFFEGLNIFLHPAALSPARRTIFERQIQVGWKHGILTIRLDDTKSVGCFV